MLASSRSGYRAGSLSIDNLSRHSLTKAVLRRIMIDCFVHRSMFLQREAKVGFVKNHHTSDDQISFSIHHSLRHFRQIKANPLIQLPPACGRNVVNATECRPRSGAGSRSSESGQSRGSCRTSSSRPFCGNRLVNDFVGC